MVKYEALIEGALSNFENLLNLWKIDYDKLNSVEYDFINPTRKDARHGACRFNIEKGIGADFAGANFTSDDFQRLGSGFSKEDFAQYNPHVTTNWGFNIIGLKQRLGNIDDYKTAAAELRKDLAEIKKQGGFIAPDPHAREQREHTRNIQKLKILKSVERTWSLCKPFERTLGDNYLRSRKIFIRDEPSVKFHAKIYNSELKASIPALLFKVQKEPDGPLVAIHRIYIAADGSRKAKLASPKMALGSIHGAGIWFGQPHKELCIVEGPENALCIRMIGHKFVVCTISAANFCNLTIPKNIKSILLMPDPDKAGTKAAEKAVKAYAAKGRMVKIVFPPKKKLPNGKFADWNDIIMGRGEKIED